MEKKGDNLYDIFINYSYSQLKSLFKRQKQKKSKIFI